jgi:hypothetical protein
MPPKDRIKTLMVQNLVLQAGVADIAADQPLFGSGSLGLDSVDAHQLVVASRWPREEREKELRWYHDHFNTPDDLAVRPPELGGGVNNPGAPSVLPIRRTGARLPA